MAHLIFIVAGFLLSALMGRLIIPRILVISLRKRLFDIPDFRKIHQHPISRLGGVTFFPVIMLVMCAITLIGLHIKGFSDQFFSNHIVDEMLCLTAGLVLLYIIGVCDDLIGVRYGRKLLVQVLAASFLPFAGLYVVDFYGLFGVDVVSPFIGIPLTVLLTVFVTNAINLIDGIDGLASGLCMIALLIFGTAFALNGVWMYSLLAFVCLGVLIPFFLYNVFGNAEHGSKIFMGDTGSLTLGFILSLFSVKYILILNTDSSAVCVEYLECLEWHDSAINLGQVRYLDNVIFSNDRSDPNTVCVTVNQTDKQISRLHGKGGFTGIVINKDEEIEIIEPENIYFESIETDEEWNMIEAILSYLTKEN